MLLNHESQKRLLKKRNMKQLNQIQKQIIDRQSIQNNQAYSNIEDQNGKQAHVKDDQKLNQQIINVIDENICVQNNQPSQKSFDQVFPIIAIKHKKSHKNKQQIIVNVADTQYAVVKDVCKKQFKWKLSYDKTESWDICWTDYSIPTETLQRMKSHQKINHFPGMYQLARKNNLALNLASLQKEFPSEYDFFPRSWILPADNADFAKQFESNGDKQQNQKVYIVKPSASCQGRGIYLISHFKEFVPSDSQQFIVQQYIADPYLIDGLKFDLRIYVLLAGCDPMRIYLYKEGLARFATQDYIQPSKNNLKNQFMHLTNYAINKDNSQFIYNESDQNDDIGHKRSLTSALSRIQKDGHDTKRLMEEIADIIVKSICTAQPVLAHQYKSGQCENYANNMCFELLGFDIILNSRCKPFLLEINHTPSFTADTPLDVKVKTGLIHDTLALMNINVKNQKELKKKEKLEFQQRIIHVKQIKLTKGERTDLRNCEQQERDAFEDANLGGFQKIFPDQDAVKTRKYLYFCKTQNDKWKKKTGGHRSQLSTKFNNLSQCNIDQQQSKSYLKCRGEGDMANTNKFGQDYLKVKDFDKNAFIETNKKMQHCLDKPCEYQFSYDLKRIEKVYFNRFHSQQKNNNSFNQTQKVASSSIGSDSKRQNQNTKNIQQNSLLKIMTATDTLLKQNSIKKTSQTIYSQLHQNQINNELINVYPLLQNKILENKQAQKPNLESLTNRNQNDITKSKEQQMHNASIQEAKLCAPRNKANLKNSISLNQLRDTKAKTLQLHHLAAFNSTSNFISINNSKQYYQQFTDYLKCQELK